MEEFEQLHKDVEHLKTEVVKQLEAGVKKLRGRLVKLERFVAGLSGTVDALKRIAMIMGITEVDKD